MGKSTVETNEVVRNEVQEVAAKPKRASRAKPKKTADQIINEVTELRTAVNELEGAIAGLDPNSVVYGIVSASVEEKRAELNKALEATYTVS